jgi:hypothetical protein
MGISPAVALRLSNTLLYINIDTLCILLVSRVMVPPHVRLVSIALYLQAVELSL